LCIYVTDLGKKFLSGYDERKKWSSKSNTVLFW